MINLNIMNDGEKRISTAQMGNWIDGMNEWMGNSSRNFFLYIGNLFSRFIRRILIHHSFRIVKMNALVLNISNKTFFRFVSFCFISQSVSQLENFLFEKNVKFFFFRGLLGSILINWCGKLMKTNRVCVNVNEVKTNGREKFLNDNHVWQVKKKQTVKNKMKNIMSSSSSRWKKKERKNL